MNGVVSRMVNDEVFSAEDAELEVQSLQREPSASIWKPVEGMKFTLIIPLTVYPPREDTDLLARRIISLGPGRGRKFLEVGTGSGALSILANYMGWKVSGCDVNPFAVAATAGNLSANGFNGDIREGGIGPEPFPFDEKFDLIIWNIPYIAPKDIGQVLGPMEEAALIDTDKLGLSNRLLQGIVSNQLLSPFGRILVLGRKESTINRHHFAYRTWDELEFEDGEQLALRCFWIPYEGAENKYVEKTGSTNEDLLLKSGIGTHLSTGLQTSGRGRRQRQWTSIEGGYAGSWIVAEGVDIKPGLLQLSGGLAVLNSLGLEKLTLKWPNDILIDGKKLCGILAEGRNIQQGMRVVLGIGMNLKTAIHDSDFEMAFLDEIYEIEFEEFDRRLHCELASLLEFRDDLPPLRHEEIRNQVLEKMKSLGLPRYNGTIFTDFDLNERGELLLGGEAIDDGEYITWV